ncbi:MAG: peptidogalycan biosysnthesis protein, partial [Candidatus Binataceae bacterium]
MDPAAKAPEILIVNAIRDIPRDEWNSLLRDDDSPFLDWDWLSAMEESGSAVRKTGWTPCHMTVRDGAKRSLAAACPLYLKTHSMGEFVFDHGWAEGAQSAGIRYYPKLLAGIPFTPHTGRRFLTSAANRARMTPILGRALVSLCLENKLSSVHINFCEPDEAPILAKLGYLERLGYQYHWRNGDFGNFDDYLNQLKHKRRHAIRHERTELDRQGVEIRIHAGEEIPDSLF